VPFVSSSVRNDREDVGVVRQQQNRNAIVGDRRQRGGQIVPAGPQVADACDPQQPRWRVEADGCVLNHADADRCDCPPAAIVIEPAVVVAEDGDDSSRRAQSRQFGRDIFRRNEAPTEHALNDKVAQHADDVGLRRIGAIDRRVELGHPVERRANVQIGEYRDTQGSRDRPGGAEAQLVSCDGETRRFEPERP